MSDVARNETGNWDQYGLSTRHFLRALIGPEAMTMLPRRLNRSTWLMPFQVTEIEEHRVVHPAQGGQFSFSLIDGAGMGRVICTLTYKTRRDAEDARRAAGE